MPGQWELEDDLRDHWRSKPHRDERQRLIKRLLNFSAKGTRVTIVSGDVHVAAAAVIESSLPQHGNGAGAIFQLVSTGIVHTRLQRWPCTSWRSSGQVKRSSSTE
ncbi:hypothetical protein P4193_02460 [Pseudomonas aeruginosa]|nr:hypothetical protein [Pseudomonas aeruginosa]